MITIIAKEAAQILGCEALDTETQNLPLTTQALHLRQTRPQASGNPKAPKTINPEPKPGRPNYFQAWPKTSWTSLKGRTLYIHNMYSLYVYIYIYAHTYICVCIYMYILPGLPQALRSAPAFFSQTRLMFRARIVSRSRRRTSRITRKRTAWMTAGAPSTYRTPILWGYMIIAMCWNMVLYLDLHSTQNNGRWTLFWDKRHYFWVLWRSRQGSKYTQNTYTLVPQTTKRTCFRLLERPRSAYASLRTVWSFGVPLLVDLKFLM